MSAESIFDLDQIAPPPEVFRLHGQELALVPAFSVADEARYQRLEERLAYETRLAQEGQRRMQAFLLARVAAEHAGTDPPAPPEPVERDPEQPVYTNALLERDVFALVERLFQASAQETGETPAIAPRDLSLRQALAVVRHLWPRRYGQRTAVPAPTPSAPEEPTPKPRKSRRASRA